MENENTGQDKLKAALKEAEDSIKAVWEIDGVTVYIKEVQIYNNKVNVNWFTFHDVNNDELGRKVENLAKQLIGEKKCQSSNLFSRMLSTMKNIFA